MKNAKRFPRQEPRSKAMARLQYTLSRHGGQSPLLPDEGGAGNGGDQNERSYHHRPCKSSPWTEAKELRWGEVTVVAVFFSRQLKLKGQSQGLDGCWKAGVGSAGRGRGSAPHPTPDARPAAPRIRGKSPGQPALRSGKGLWPAGGRALWPSTDLNGPWREGGGHVRQG